jgi:putative transposase
MPRRARLSLPGIPWHIIQRGNNRSVCFHAEEDYHFYLHYLKEFADKFGCAVHAYVLMTNHVHLLLTPQRADSAGLLMKHLGQRYVQYVNRTYKRTGTLWEGRFRSCLTQTEDYVLACYRYIELNPVRAGMVIKPQDYRWSSYHANGLGKPNVIIAAHDEYTRLGLTDADRRDAYRALFRAHVDAALTDEIRDATNGNFALGGKRFQAQVAKALGRRVTRGIAGRPVLKSQERDGKQGELL